MCRGLFLQPSILKTTVNMNKILIQSSVIECLGYDSDHQLMEVEFSDGSIRRYYEVPPADYERHANSKSHGRHFVRRINEAYRSTEVNFEIE